MITSPEQSETKMLVEQHAANYLAQFHEEYLIQWPRDMALSVKLLKQYAYAKLAQWNREFISSTDPQITKGGFSFPQFFYHLSKVITASHSSRTVKLLKGVYYDAEQTRTPIRDAVALLAVSFNKMDMEAPQTRSYERALKDITDADVLQKAAELLIDEAANGRQFYPLPKPSDVKGACAKVIEAMRLKAFAEVTMLCDHTPRYFEELSRPDGSTILQRCSHWKLALAAMEKVGHPLLLPSYAREDGQ